MRNNFLSKFLIVFIVMTILIPLLFGVSAYADTGGNRQVPKTTIGDDGNIIFEGGAMADLQDKKDGKDVWADIFEQYRGVIAGISGVAALTMIAVFIINWMKLAASSTNPAARTQATAGLLWSGIATIGLGSVSLFVGFFYNAI